MATKGNGLIILNYTLFSPTLRIILIRITTNVGYFIDRLRNLSYTHIDACKENFIVKDLHLGMMS